MIKTVVNPLRRMASLTTLMGLLVVLTLSFSLAACGGDAAPAAPPSGSSASGSSSSGSATAVAISEQTGGNDVYSFTPATVTIKAGDAIKFTNNSDENHKLAVTPAGPTVGTVTKSGSNDNTSTVTFPSAGTFTITSQLVDRLKDGKHTPDPADSKAMLTVTVQ